MQISNKQSVACELYKESENVIITSNKNCFNVKNLSSRIAATAKKKISQIKAFILLHYF